MVFTAAGVADGGERILKEERPACTVIETNPGVSRGNGAPPRERRTKTRTRCRRKRTSVLSATSPFAHLSRETPRVFRPVSPLDSVCYLFSELFFFLFAACLSSKQSDSWNLFSQLPFILIFTACCFVFFISFFLSFFPPFLPSFLPSFFLSFSRVEFSSFRLKVVR